MAFVNDRQYRPRNTTILTIVLAHLFIVPAVPIALAQTGTAPPSADSDACRPSREVHLPINLRSAVLLVLPIVSLTQARAGGVVRQGTIAPKTTSATSASSVEYDVASIKINRSGAGTMKIDRGGDSFRATNISLKTLVSEAYGKREDLIEGLPGWSDSLRFDLYAKMSDPDPVAIKQLTYSQRQAMLAIILARRFNLTAHTLTQNRPVYNLVVGKAGVKLGTGHEHSGDAAYSKVGAGGMVVNSSEIIAIGVPISYILNPLAQSLGRTVIDNTSLSGNYDIHIKWTPDNNQSSEPAQEEVSLFTAIQEQTGLKLEPGTGPVEVLIVDHVDKPTVD